MHGQLPKVDEADAIEVHPRRSFGFGLILRTMFARYWKRALVGFSLMVSQAFLYNAIFFTYALVLTRFYDVAGEPHRALSAALRLRQCAGRARARPLFDTIGRRQMIAATYALSAVLLVADRLAVRGRCADAVTLTRCGR